MDFASRLDLLLDVAESGSFAKAADKKHIDRSVVSKQVKSLEDDLGVRLLNRSTRSLSLTPVGIEVIKQARKSRQLLSDTRQIVQAFQVEPVGKIRITSSTMFARLYLEAPLFEFKRKYPNISIDIEINDNRVDLVSESLDVAFRIGPLRDSSLVAKKLADNRMTIIASHTFIEKHGHPNTPEELIELPAVTYGNEQFVSDKIRIMSSESSMEIKTYTMKSSFRVNQTDTIMRAVKAGMGYAQIGQFMVEHNLKDDGLVELLPEYKLPTHGEVYALYTHRNPSPFTKLFVEMVQNHIGSPPVWEQRMK
ncbi:TPA: LysR family transcriptional regulator [Vibrio alginolyticus]